MLTQNIDKIKSLYHFVNKKSPLYFVLYEA